MLPAARNAQPTGEERIPIDRVNRRTLAVLANPIDGQDADPRASAFAARIAALYEEVADDLADLTADAVRRHAALDVAHAVEESDALRAQIGVAANRAMTLVNVLRDLSARFRDAAQTSRDFTIELSRAADMVGPAAGSEGSPPG